MINQPEITSRQSYSKATVAIIATIASTLVFGIIPIMMRWSTNEISPNATIFNRCWIAAVIFGLWQELSRRGESAGPAITNQSLDNKQIPLLLATAVFFGATQLLWVWSLTQTSVANSTFLHNLTPFFTTLAGWLFFNQRFNYKFLVGVVIATVGTIILGLGDLQVDSLKLQGDLLALLSALFWTAYLLAIEKLRTQLTVTTILTWNCRMLTLFFVPILFIVKDEWFPLSWNGWSVVIALAVTIICGYGLLVYSVKHLSSSLIAMICLLEPVVTAFLASTIFAEALGWLNLVAFAIILLGIYLAIVSEAGIVEQADECQELSSEATD